LQTFKLRPAFSPAIVGNLNLRLTSGACLHQTFLPSVINSPAILPVLVDGAKDEAEKTQYHLKYRGWKIWDSQMSKAGRT